MCSEGVVMGKSFFKVSFKPNFMNFFAAIISNNRTWKRPQQNLKRMCEILFKRLTKDIVE